MPRLPRMTIWLCLKFGRVHWAPTFSTRWRSWKSLEGAPLGGLRLRFTCGGDPLGYIAHLLDMPHRKQWQYRLDYIIFYLLARRVYHPHHHPHPNHPHNVRGQPCHLRHLSVHQLLLDHVRSWRIKQRQFWMLFVTIKSEDTVGLQLMKALFSKLIL